MLLRQRDLEAHLRSPSEDPPARLAIRQANRSTRSIALLAALGCLGFAVAATGRADALRPERTVEGSVLVSTDLPRIRIWVDPALRYLGRVPFRLGDFAAGERLVFAATEGPTVRRLLIAHFESFLPGSDQRFNYDLSKAPSLGGHRFRHNVFAFSNRAAAASNPTGEAALTAAFLAEAGYRFADEWLTSRYVTVAGEDRRHELIVFYVEMAPDLGVSLAELYTPEDQESELWRTLGGQLHDRALRAFEVLAEDADGAVDAAASGDEAAEAAAAAAAELAAAALDERRVPGLSLVVLRGDETVVARGYGETEIGGAEGVTPATVFQLGSISKQFLAALVVALAEEGRLSLDDPAARHLAGFDQLPPELTVRHLLDHTGGVRELFTLPEAATAYDDLTRSRGEMVAAVRRAPVDFAPGSRWAYSNTHYTLLALAVERLTGKPYEEALAERFFRPLGLASLRGCTPLPAGPGEARGHELADGAVVVSPPENMNWIRGDGGLCGNALDVARCTRLLATGRVVTPAAYATMTTPARLAGGGRADYGFGLSLVAPEGGHKVSHNGAMRGFSASAAHYPDAELTVVVLTNRGDVRTESIERGVARRLLGLPPPVLAEQPLSAAERRRFAGRYDIGVFVVQVVDRDGRLWLEMPPPGPTTALRYLGGGEFAGEADPEAFRLSFAADDAEPAGELRLLMAAMHWYGIRRP